MILSGVTIAFDLDGTLVDTAPDLIGALNVVLGECDLAPLPTAAARSLVGRGAKALITRGFEVAGETLDQERMPELFARFLDIYRGRIAGESRPFEGLEAALDRLSEAGATLCVCTNKLTDLSILLLVALNLHDRFGAVIGADSAPKPKPDASHLRMAILEAGGDPTRAIMVGDSETDVLTARALGVPVIAVPFGYTDIPPADLGADILIQHFDELPAAIMRLTAALNPAKGSAIGSPSLDQDA